MRYVPVTHTGNTSSSLEETIVVLRIVKEILKSNSKWTDRQGNSRDILLKDILIIAPYNAQAFEINLLLREARVGTVDKFQGQEAPITIYSMATSSHAQAPRGMEFLYSIQTSECRYIPCAVPYDSCSFATGICDRMQDTSSNAACACTLQVFGIGRASKYGGRVIMLVTVDNGLPIMLMGRFDSCRHPNIISLIYTTTLEVT